MLFARVGVAPALLRKLPVVRELEARRFGLKGVWLERLLILPERVWVEGRLT